MMKASSNQEMAQAIKQDVMNSLHCAMPGRIESYDSETCTATVRPMIRSAEGRAFPLLMDVPVYVPLPELMTISAGDFCLVVFADYAIDGWFSGQEDAATGIERNHDLSDAFAFVGFRPVA